ncbi:Peptidase family M23 [Pelagirhabdus alkalitolerans]|uniref:Peptidase family M23 n=1 Tax=Pelagirhabdus alkalitolerans TaxID=1612202 RepID=A0A1G6LS70_9BACI|nr:M23 family metallopeptidase [Pelagirhabdus alkalitolerans]SDC45944.1 Peptidase family M23 [Pelagirhabdus alkalitolerans]
MYFIIILCLIFLFNSPVVFAEVDEPFYLYKKTETITHVPWYYLAAIDQYESQLSLNNEEPHYSFFDPIEWYGLTNMNQDPNIITIQMHNGAGKDGTGNKEASLENHEDQLFTLATYLSTYSPTETELKNAIWRLYERPLSVKTILQNAKVYKQFNTTDLSEKAFPIPSNHHYSYQSTWGSGRGFGGRRIHEGCDIFAHYGTPVQSTAYGTVEIMGWNTYGGWRIGIRDLDNTYHYFAHLQHFDSELEVGSIVAPGDIIGSVGASGYGPPGTSGKFPPHLHYGLYRDDGYTVYSYDPYPKLKLWEQ